MAAPQRSYPWTDIWTMAITRPRPETYLTLLEDVDHRPARSIRWMFLTSMVLAIITYNAVFNNQVFQQQVVELMADSGTIVSDAAVNQALLLMTVCATPFAALFNVLLYLTLAMLINFAAQRIAAEVKPERQQHLLYLVGAVVAPLTVISALTNILPGILSLVLSVGVLALQAYIFVQIVRAVYAFAPQQAIIAALIPTLLFYGVQWLVVGSLL